MATALALLQTFNNSVLRALTPEQLQTAINTVRSEVSQEAYGSLYEAQVADLAAHDLIMEKAADDTSQTPGSSSGQALTVKRYKVGPREVEYAVGSSSGGGSDRSDEDLGQSFYGKRFLRRRDSTVVGLAISE